MIMPLGQNLPSVTVRKRKFKILNELLVLQGKKKDKIKPLMLLIHTVKQLSDFHKNL